MLNLLPLLVLLCLLVILTACAEQDLKDTGSIVLRSLCKSSRNCTVENPYPR